MIATPRDGELHPLQRLCAGVQKPRRLRQALDAALAHGGLAVEDAPGWRKAPGNDRYLVYVRDPASEL